MIIFVHIAKTAGTSFNKMIEDNFSNKFKSTEEIEDWSREYGSIYDAFQSGGKVGYHPEYCDAHFGHGFHRLFDCDYKYVTMLRDPVDRTISAIRFNAHRVPRNNPGIFADSVFQSLYTHTYKNNKPQTFVKNLQQHNILCNQMTKQLSGLMNLDDISLSQELKNTALWFPPYFHEKRLYSDVEMSNILDAAIANVEKYAFVGIQERMQSSMLRFGKIFPKLNIKAITSRHKASQNRYLNVNKSVIATIKDMNKYDIMLYEHFKDKL